MANQPPTPTLSEQVDEIQRLLSAYGQLSLIEIARRLEKAEAALAAKEAVPQSPLDFIRSEAARTAGNGPLGQFWAEVQQHAESLAVNRALADAVQATRSLREKELQAERVGSLMDMRLDGVARATTHQPVEEAVPQPVIAREWQAETNPNDSPLAQVADALRQKAEQEAMGRYLKDGETPSELVVKWRKEGYSSACANELEAALAAKEAVPQVVRCESCGNLDLHVCGCYDQCFCGHDRRSHLPSGRCTHLDCECSNGLHGHPKPVEEAVPQPVIATDLPSIEAEIRPLIEGLYAARVEYVAECRRKLLAIFSTERNLHAAWRKRAEEAEAREAQPVIAPQCTKEDDMKLTFPTARRCARCKKLTGTASYTRKNTQNRIHESAYLCRRCVRGWLVDGNGK